jgi:hypothetical protein
MRLLFLTSIIIFCTNLFGQTDSLDLLIYANPSGKYRVKINGQLQPKTHVFKVNSGENNIEVWSPNYLKTDTIISIKNEPCTLKVKLNKTPELVKYQSLINDHSRLSNKTMFFTVSSLMGLTSSAIALYYNSQSHLNKVKADNGYKYSVDGYNLSEKKDANNNYIFNNIVLYGGASIFAGSVMLIIKTIKQKKALEKPTLIKDTSFILENIGMNLKKDNVELNFTIRF